MHFVGMKREGDELGTNETGLRPQRSGELVPVQAWHIEIHQQAIGMMLACCSQPSVMIISRLAVIPPQPQEGAQTFSGVLVVIDDEDVESPFAQLKPCSLGLQGSPGVHELVCPLAWWSLADHLPCNW